MPAAWQRSLSFVAVAPTGKYSREGLHAHVYLPWPKWTRDSQIGAAAQWLLNVQLLRWCKLHLKGGRIEIALRVGFPR